MYVIYGKFYLKDKVFNPGYLYQPLLYIERKILLTIHSLGFESMTIRFISQRLYTLTVVTYNMLPSLSQQSYAFGGKHHIYNHIIPNNG